MNKTGLHPARVKKRLWRVILPGLTAATLTASLTMVAAGPAGAAVQAPARTAATSVASRHARLPAVSLKAAARYVHFGHRRFTFETDRAKRHGVSRKAIEAEGIMVGAMDALLHSRIAAVNKAHDGVAFDMTRVVRAAARAVHAGSKAVRADARAVRAHAKGLSITLLNGITISITTTGFKLKLSKAAAAAIENISAIAASFIPLLGAVLTFIVAFYVTVIATAISVATGIPVAVLLPLIPLIVPIVTATLTLLVGSIGSVVKLCSASNGTATFTFPWPGNGFPSCSGLSGL